MAARGMAMPKVRGRFKVVEVTRWSFHRHSALVKLESVNDEIPAADDTLSLSTGAASVTIMITNQALVDRFLNDQHFEIDFTPVD
jgi:hypothetical protein